jgi:gamma-aminobutyric acid type B receptor
VNYLIGTGAIILYVDIYIRVVPTTDELTVKVLCNVTPWLTAIGYSLCYGTIVAKMVRVYFIFNNPKPNSTSVRG